MGFSIITICLFHIHCILSVLLPTLLNNNCSFKNPFLYIMFTSLHFDIYLPNILYHTSKRSVKFKSEQIWTVALLYNTHSLKYTDFWNITKRELIKKAQKVIFEDSQEFLQMLFDIAKKESIYISQKKIQAAPRQITITLFIIINKIVSSDF